jgi:flagellar protein FliS
MNASAREAYLETQILTSTPQRLRLMLIEGAIRRAKAAQAAWQANNVPEGLVAVGHCRDIVSELIAGIQPEQTPVAKQVLAVYMFLFSTLVEAQIARDIHRLTDIIRVLDQERITWQAVCEQMPQRPVATVATKTAEEVAPQRVSSAWTADFGAAAVTAAAKSAASGFSIDA